MLKNYLLVTFRNLLKNKLYTGINIAGLGIAIAVCIVAFFNYMFDYEFDRNHINFDEIHRITCFRDMEGREQEYGVVPSSLAHSIRNDIPGIKDVARLQRTSSPVKIGDNIFPANVSFVDPSFLSIFSFTPVQGSTSTISGTNEVLLSNEMAKTLFGSEFPVGKQITLVNDRNEEFSFTVAAVFNDMPDNSSFRIDILAHYDTFLHMWNQKDADWKFLTTAVFIQVSEKSALQSVTNTLNSYLPVQNKAREDFRINRFTLIPLEEVGENTRETWSSGLYPSLHPAAIVAPPVMALLILLIACFNYTNTSRAAFSKRLKEIGLRKTFGGQRKQLITQFMIETLVICILALFVGVALASVLVPAYSNLWAYMSISLSFSQYKVFWLFLVLLLLGTGFISGVYPAIFVSGYNPVNVLKGTRLFKGTGFLSVILLTLQFTISVMALVMGIVFSKNSSYQKELDLGYERNKLIIVPVNSDLYAPLKSSVEENPDVLLSSGTNNPIGWGRYRRPLKYEEKQIEVDMLDVSAEYPQTTGLRLISGRFSDVTRAEADRASGAIIINKRMADTFGWEDPVGKSVTMYDTNKLTVIGVVDDYYTNGVWGTIEPAVMRVINSRTYSFLTVSAEPEKLGSVLEFLRAEWKELKTNMIFDGVTQEETMQEEKDINGSILKVNLFLAVVATLLSVIGMFNMVSIDILKRTKEIGVRKIEGAPVPILMYILSRKYILVLAIASLLGSAGGYFMSNMLMDSIWDYFVKIGPGILIASSAIMIVLTAATLIFKIYSAAMRNPADTLRYE